MDLKQTASSLSAIEIKALKALNREEFISMKEISGKAGMQMDSARRAVQWLKEKGMIELSEERQEELALTQTGKSSLGKRLPERLFVEALQALGGKASLEQVQKKSQLNRPELNAAMGIAKRNAWISVRPGKGLELELTGLEKQLEEGKYPLENVLEEIAKKVEITGEDKNALQEAMKRGLVEKVLETEQKARLNKEGKEALKLVGAVKERAYNVEGAVPKIFIGKRQPYVQFLEQLRKKLVNLGFKEMKERLIVQEFYNFDVLFQPQNHPARAWTDTYQLKQPRFGKLPLRKAVAAVKAAHENGAGTGSKGWRYSWDEKIASRLMPNAHGTTADARQMAEGIEIPGKYFVINRCYRPDVIDAKHLVEFNQFDGFIVGKGINFRHLLSILEKIAVEVGGAEEVKFFPDYYPFTEPSVQLSAKHPKLGWIELAGGGVFRPEVVKPLGIDVGAIAWGMGIDRLAMLKLGVKDIRYLFAKDLNWLRNSKMVVE
ncbi:MAG: phenylalanine--tRNA ligase subunit alpha [Candidatus Diapherotrites archaeon]|uniref:phenylalanine--tRNA ligase n=1 Tax=Candidatus Iainarchaeum sp. TaxID=3101447 RepID=A0A939C529_9ARCH|nr:phenylalanine--tRNA ligase subunit alpha [Candidatus Diapherotrites archaeon]